MAHMTFELLVAYEQKVFTSKWELSLMDLANFLALLVKYISRRNVKSCPKLNDL